VLLNLSQKITKNWKLKIACLLLATVIWYVIDQGISSRKDPQLLQKWGTQDAKEEAFIR